MYEAAFNFLNQGWVGSAIGIVGIFVGCIFSVFFYFRSKKKAKPMVQYYNMTILSSAVDDMPSDVEITYKGSKIKSLSKTNIILWNDGTETLHGSSVVDGYPVRFSFGEYETILRCQIVKETRSVNRARLELVDGRKNAVDVLFDFFDPNDGINIEILHDSKSVPQVSGTIRGLPSGIRIINSGHHGPVLTLARSIGKTRIRTTMITSMLVMGFGMFFAGVAAKFGVLHITSSRIDEAGSTAMMAAGGSYIITPIIMLWYIRKRYPKELREQ